MFFLHLVPTPLNSTSFCLQVLIFPVHKAVVTIFRFLNLKYCVDNKWICNRLQCEQLYIFLHCNCRWCILFSAIDLNSQDLVLCFYLFLHFCLVKTFVLWFFFFFCKNEVKLKCRCHLPSSFTLDPNSLLCFLEQKYSLTLSLPPALFTSFSLRCAPFPLWASPWALSHTHTHTQSALGLLSFTKQPHCPGLTMATSKQLTWKWRDVAH